MTEEEFTQEIVNRSFNGDGDFQEWWSSSARDTFVSIGKAMRQTMADSDVLTSLAALLDAAKEEYGE